MHRYGYAQGGYDAFHPIVDILWIVILVALIAGLARWMIRDGRRGMWMRMQDMHHNAPLELLKERYAKGKIDKAEFDQKKKDLTS